MNDWSIFLTSPIARNPAGLTDDIESPLATIAIIIHMRHYLNTVDRV